MISLFDIDDDDIRALRDEAGSAGDAEQVRLCDLALSYDSDAWRECSRVILANRSQIKGAGR